MSGDEWTELVDAFEMARRTYRWNDEESVIGEAFRYDAAHPGGPSLVEFLRARQQFAPVHIELQEAA